MGVPKRGQKEGQKGVTFGPSLATMVAGYPKILVRLTEMSLGGWSQMIKILVRLTEMSFGGTLSEVV